MASLIRILNTLIVLVIFSAAHAFAGERSGIVTRVTDGDTIRVSVDQKVEKYRLHGIDSPEIGQDFGAEAKDFVIELSSGRTVTVERMGSDRYRRSLAIVRLPDGRSLNAEMVRQGYAWWSRRHAPDDLELAKADREARAHRRGLWRQPEPIPPWVWRAEKRKSRESDLQRSLAPVELPIQ